MRTDVVKESFNRVSVFGTDFADYLFKELFKPERQPIDPASGRPIRKNLRDLFPGDGPGMGEHKTRFLNGMTRVMQNVDRANVLVPILRRMGRNHRYKYGVEEWMYPIVGESLIAALAHFDSEWTNETQEHWLAIYSFCQAEMLYGANHPDESIPGEFRMLIGTTPQDAIAVTADSVAAAEFRLVGPFRRGFDRREVMRFLALVHGELSQLEADRKHLRAVVVLKDERITELRERSKNSDLRHIPGEVRAERRHRQ